MDSDGVFHPEMQISGPLTITKPTGNMVQQTGPDGDLVDVPEVAPIPGFFFNLRVFGQLKITLETDPVSGEPYPQTDADGNLLPLLERTRLAPLVIENGAVVSAAPITGDEKRPPRIDMGQFQVFDLAAVATPSNVWA